MWAFTATATCSCSRRIATKSLRLWKAGFRKLYGNGRRGWGNFKFPRFPLGFDLCSAAGLGSVAAQMLNFNRVPPGNLFLRDAQRSGQSLALHWTRDVIAAHDRRDDLGIQSRALDELIDADSHLVHVDRDRLHGILSALRWPCPPRHESERSASRCRSF